MDAISIIFLHFANNFWVERKPFNQKCCLPSLYKGFSFLAVVILYTYTTLWTYIHLTFRKELFIQFLY